MSVQGWRVANEAVHAGKGLRMVEDTRTCSNRPSAREARSNFGRVKWRRSPHPKLTVVHDPHHPLYDLSPWLLSVLTSVPSTARSVLVSECVVLCANVFRTDRCRETSRYRYHRERSLEPFGHAVAPYATFPAVAFENPWENNN